MVSVVSVASASDYDNVCSRSILNIRGIYKKGESLETCTHIRDEAPFFFHLPTPLQYGVCHTTVKKKTPPSANCQSQESPSLPTSSRAHPLSISLLRRLRTRTPTHTPLIMPPLPQPLLRTQLQLPIQLRTRLLAMNEIAEPATHAPLTAVQPTTSFAEIGHGGKFAVYGAGGVPAGVQRVAGGLRRVFVFEACVDVAY